MNATFESLTADADQCLNDDRNNDRLKPGQDTYDKRNIPICCVYIGKSQEYEDRGQDKK